MNTSLENLRKTAIKLNILPFHEIKPRQKRGTMIHFKPKTKQELVNNINRIDPKIRKRMRQVHFCNTTTNNSGNTKSLFTTRTGKGPRTLKAKSPQKTKCNDAQIKKDCKFSRRGNQGSYTPVCLSHFPCFHKKGYSQMNNANNYKHYLQMQNVNFKSSPSTVSKRESRQNYGYIPAKNTLLLRSHKHKNNLAIWKKINSTVKGQLILLNNGNILEVKRNANGVLRINKK